MVKAFSGALLFATLYFFCLLVTSSSQKHLRPNHSAIRGYDKINASALSSIKRQIKNFHLIRKQRQALASNVHMIHSDVWVLRGFQNRRGCPKAAHQFKVFQYTEGEFYAVIATSAVNNNTEIFQFSAERGCEKLVATLSTRLSFDFEVVRVKDIVRIVVLEQNPLAHPHKRSGSSVFNLNFENGQNITSSRGEVLKSEEPTCITSWEQFGVPHIAICSSKTRDFEGVESYQTWSLIYCATGGYFDICGSISTHFPQAIRHFRIFTKHYLAVANHPNTIVGEHVSTEIFTYDLGSKKYRHLQYLPTKGAKDICFLELGSGLDADHFLFVVNQLSTADGYSQVYKFIGEKWEPFQMIKFHSKNVTTCHTYQADNRHTAILFGTSWGADVYQYNGWRFVSTVEYSKFALGSGISRFGTVKINQETLITVANSNPQNSDSDNVFSPTFSKILDGTLSSVYANGISSCQKMANELKFDPVRLIVDLYPKAVKKNDTIIRLGKVDFNLLSTKYVWTDDVEYPANKTRLGATQIFQLQNISFKIDDLNRKLIDLTQRRKLAMRTSGDYIINGKVHVKSLVSTCVDNSCTMNNVTAQTVNSVNVNDVYLKSINKKDKYIPSLKIRQLTIRKSVNTTSLSNHPIEDYLQVHKANNFTRKFIVNGNVVINGHLNVSGSVNNKVLSPSTLLLKKGIQNLNWTLRARNISLKHLKTQFIEDKEIDHLYINAVSNTTNFTLFQPKFFSALTVSKLTLKGLVNNVNLTDLEKSSMKLIGDQVVTGIHGYKAANLGKLNLNGPLNGKQFPTDFISVGEKDHLKLSTLQLTQETSFAHLSVAEKFAGMPVENGRWGTNLLNKSTDQLQVITGHKSFEIVKSSNSIKTNTLNKRKMDSFQTASSLYGHPEELLTYDSIDVKGDVKFEKPLSVADTEGVGLQLLEEKGVPLTTEDFPPIRSLILTQNVKVSGDLSTNMLDGIPSSGIFFRDGKGPLILSGRKTFTKPVVMNKTFTLLYTLNGYNLKDLWNEALKIEGNQTLSGSLLIKNNVDVVKLKAKYSQLVPLASPGSLTGQKNFQSLSVKGSWFVDTLDVGGLINDVNVSSWPSDTVLKNGENQIINSQKSILHLTAKNAEVAAIDDIDIKRLLDVVLATEPATIFSDVEFGGLFFSKKMSVNGTIDEVPSDAPLTWLRYDVPQNLSGSLLVRETLRVENLRQDSWMINKVNLKNLLSQAVGINESRQLASFHLKHVVVDDLILEGLLQGYNITEDLVLKHSDDKHRSIKGVKSFSGPLVSESLHVAKTLNNLDPKDICKTPVPEQNSKWIVYGNVVVRPKAKVNISFVNNHRLDKITHQLWLKDDNVRVESKQIINNAIVNGYFSQDKINNVDLVDLNRRSIKLSSTSEQLITGSHQFKTVHANTLTIGVLNSTFINDIDLNFMTNSVLLRDVEQNISNHIIFQDLIVSNISIDGMLNGVDVNASLMRTDRERVITGRKSVENLVVGSVKMCDKCLVDTFDLSNWASRSVLRKGNFTISGGNFDTVSFQQPLSLAGSLNNVQIGRDHLLTLTDPQEINGQLLISSKLPTTIQYSSEKGHRYQKTTEEFQLAARFKNLHVNGLYNGIDLPHFYKQLVRRDMDVVFSEPVTLFSLIAKSLDDLSVNSTLRDIINLPLNVSHHVAPSAAISLSDSVEHEQISSLVHEIKSVALSQPIELKYFEEVSISRPLPPVVDAIYTWVNRSGDIELCSYVKKSGSLYCDGSNQSLLNEVDVTGVSPMKDADDFAVATFGRNASFKNHSFIFSRKSENRTEKQTIQTDFPIATASFILSGEFCFLFLEKSSRSPIYCRPLNSSGSYSFSQNISTIDARLVSVAQRNKDSPPLLIIASASQRGYDHITAWNYNSNKSRFEQSKSTDTLQIVAMDSICNEDVCLLVTVAPSKPAAIPGQVIIWSLNESGLLKRLQRIAISEPIDAKFALFPNGRVSLMILQNTGVDNLFVFVRRGFQQFHHETTIRVPGARNLQLVSNDSNLMLALTVASPVSEVPYDPVRMFRARFFGRLI